MNRLRARPGGPPCGARSTSDIPAGTGNGGASPPPRSPPTSTLKQFVVPPVRPATRVQPLPSKPAKSLERLPAHSVGPTLVRQGPGVKAVERIVGLSAALAFLKDLQAHAHQCEADVRTSGAGAALFPVAASIANLIDVRLSRLDPPAPEAPDDA